MTGYKAWYDLYPHNVWTYNDSRGCHGLTGAYLDVIGYDAT